MKHNKSSAHILVRNTSWIYAAKIVTQVLGVVALVLVIRKIDVEIFGRFNLFLSLFMLFGIFAVSPSIGVFRRYIPQLREQHDAAEMVHTVIKWGAIACGLSLLIGGGLLGLHGQLGRLLKIGNMAEILPLFLAYVVCHGIHQLLTSLLTSLLLHKISAILQIAGSLCRTVLYFILFNHLTVQALLLVEAVVAIVYMVPGSIAFLLWFKSFKVENASGAQSAAVPPDRQRVARYGLFSFFNEIGAGIVGRASDYYIVAALGTPLAVGLYAFAGRMFKLFSQFLPVQDFLSVLRPVFITRFTRAHTQEDFLQVYNFIVKVMLPVYTFPGLFFLAVGRPVIAYVFDPKYLGAYWTSVIVLFMTLPMAFGLPLGLTVELKEQMQVKVYSKSVAVLSIIGGILGMKFFGIIGVAAVTLLCDWTKNLIMQILLRREIRIRHDIKSLRGYIGAWLTLSLGFYFLQPYITSLILTVLVAGVFCALFGLTLVVFHPFSAQDLVMLDKLGTTSKRFTPVRRVVLRLFSGKQYFVQFLSGKGGENVR
jgi:O-antigen/teichoic acid export membrane protein